MNLLAVLGHPIGHSLSPVMHEAAAQQLGLDVRYIPIDVRPQRLREALAALVELGFRGANLTIPLKQTALELVDECSEDARRIGAINTLEFVGGRVLGSNTDGQGWLTSLQTEVGVHVRGMRVALLGAGGAARAIADALLVAGVERVDIYNRTEQRAERLADAPSRWHCCHRIAGGALTACATGKVDLLVQTTALGMSHYAEDQLPIAVELLHADLIVSDIVYRPLMTPLLLAARARGARIHGGVGMLVGQGALAFHKWFRVQPPLAVMRAALLSVLEEKGETRAGHADN